MKNLDQMSDRALELASRVGNNLQTMSQNMSPGAGTWLRTGIKIGALRSGARVARGMVRRNPVLAIATAAGAGLLWYAARRKAKQAGDGAIEGSSKRVEARRVNGGSAARKTAPRKRAARKRTSASASTH